MALDGAASICTPHEIPKNGSYSEIDRGRALDSCCATGTTGGRANGRRSEKCINAASEEQARPRRRAILDIMRARRRYQASRA